MSRPSRSGDDPTPTARPVPNARGRATRAALEVAALELAEERGAAAVTVAAVCERAGVSRRTFFHHFRGRDEALLGSAAPSLDADAARRLVQGDAPLLPAVLALVAIPAVDPAEAALAARRRRIAAGDPALAAAARARLEPLVAQVAALVERRLRRAEPALGERAAAAAEGVAAMASALLLAEHEAGARGAERPLDALAAMRSPLL